MYQNYPNYYQPQVPQQRQQQPIQMQQQITPSILKGRLVSSVEEVKAAPIDFDGSVSFFPDLANKKIYTKQINLDGTASLNMYELKDMPIAPSTSNPSYITREEFEDTISKLQAAFEQIQGINAAVPSKEKTFDF